MKQLVLLAAALFSSVADGRSQRGANYNSYLYGNGWYMFEMSGANISLQDVLANKQAYGLSAHDSLAVFTDLPDSGTNKHHYRFHQYHKGYFVEDAQFIVHTDGNRAMIATSQVVPYLNKNVATPITQAAAIQAAINVVAATKYAWQDSNFQEVYRERMEDSTAVYSPPCKLVIARRVGGGLDSSCYCFCWSVYLKTVEPRGAWRVLVDARSGQVIEVEDPTDKGSGYCSTSSHIATDYYGEQHNQMATWKKLVDFNWKLKDCRRIVTTSYGTLLKDGDNDWRGDPSEVKPTAAHWIGGKVWDYFKDVWGRNGVDGMGKEINIDVVPGSSSWNGIDHILEVGETVTVGFTAYSHTAYDIIAHEYTHGIIDYTANLVSEKEPGALNESFADIFGNRFDVHVGLADWTMGEDVPFFDERHLDNPLLDNNPNYYKGTHWVTTDPCSPTRPGPYGPGNDKCGVHTNLGVQNRWFYVLCLSAGVNEASQIAWRNFTKYLGPHSKYVDARMGSIIAAKDLFGACSNEVKETILRWNQVGVFPGDIDLFLSSECIGLVRNPSTETLPACPPPLPINPPFDPTRRVLSEPQPQSIHLFPNPTANVLNIVVPEEWAESQFKLLNAVGQVVMQTVLSVGTNTISLGNLPSGVYSACIASAFKNRTEKVVVNR